MDYCSHFDCSLVLGVCQFTRHGRINTCPYVNRGRGDSGSYPSKLAQVNSSMHYFGKIMDRVFRDLEEGFLYPWKMK